MKMVAIIYSLILVFFGAGMFFLSMASSHQLDRGLIVTNLAIIFSFPLTIYYLNKNFYRNEYEKRVLILCVVNTCIFSYCFYDLFKDYNDGFSDAAMSLLLPGIGLILSLIFVIKFVVTNKRIAK